MWQYSCATAVASLALGAVVACSGANGTPSSSSGGAASEGGNAVVPNGGASTSNPTRGGTTQTVGGNAAVGGGSAAAGGSSTTFGGSSAGGAAPGGTVSGTGGAGSPAGGRTGVGGASDVGGKGTLGGASSVGGDVSSGGATLAAGGTASGGNTAKGGSSTAASGGSGNTGACVATCGTHKWACWKMPNPAGSGLPNLASYTSTTDVVHDNVTCLDWQRSPPSTTHTNAAAIAYCEGLTLGGYDDWRAPTRVEMMSIMDWTRSPATDAVFTAASGFHKTGSNWVLTIDQRGAGAGKDLAWAFNMGDGITSNAYSAATPARIRCVRGNGTGEAFSEKAVAPPNQYTIISTDEVQDNYTGLIWQRSGNASGLLSWDAAVTYCANLTLGGASWRLPSVRELSTLVDETLVAPSINRTMFPNTQYGARSNNWYWASHRQRGSTSASWGLNFDDGFTGFNAGASGSWNYWTQAYVKCVR